MLHLLYCSHAYAGVVYDVIDRQSETRDPAIANVDQMLLVMSLNLPPFDAQQATRFLVSSEAAEIPVTLLLNKADLMTENETATVIDEVRLPLSHHAQIPELLGDVLLTLENNAF